MVPYTTICDHGPRIKIKILVNFFFVTCNSIQYDKASGYTFYILNYVLVALMYLKTSSYLFLWFSLHAFYL